MMIDSFRHDRAHEHPRSVLGPRVKAASSAARAVEGQIAPDLMRVRARVMLAAPTGRFTANRMCVEAACVRPVHFPEQVS